METQRVRNPLTRRMINVGGPTYTDLIVKGYTFVNGELQAPTVTVPKVTVPKVISPKVTSPKVRVPVTSPKVTSPKVQVPKVTVPKVTSPKVQVIPGWIPKVEPLEIQRQKILDAEERERAAVCANCDAYYIQRYTAFTVPELRNLQLIQQNCAKCSDLCARKYQRLAVPNAPACVQYKTAALRSSQQLAKLESQAMGAYIRAEAAAGRPVGHLFPKVPK